MPNLILQAVIDNRRAVLLDLVREIEGNDRREIIGEDIYIISLPPVTSPILQVQKSSFAQSLIDQIDDIHLQNLPFRFFKDKEGDPFILELGGIAGGNSSEYFIEPSLSLDYQEMNDEMSLNLTQHPHPQKAKFGNFEIEIRLLYQGKTYHTILAFYYSPAKDILQAGLDFGSEASQIMDGRADNINATPFALFESIRENIQHKIAQRGPQYLQGDIDNPFFYRSVFFAKKKLDNGLKQIANSGLSVVEVNTDLNIVTDQKIIEDDEKAFYNEWKQVPNLKLIGNINDANQDFTFKVRIDNIAITQSLQELKDPIYAGLLDGMISSYLKSTIRQPVLLRFTLLVPNIYNIERVNKAKAMVRYLFEKFKSENNGRLKAAEISTLSESDASFLGATNYFPIKKGKYYIVIDCGKGTTDYSIVSTDGISFKSEYRNGFAGAGNLISFGILQAILFFLKGFSQDESYNFLIASFLENNLSEGSANYFKNALHEKIESLKKSYDPSKTKEEVEFHWKQAETGSFTFDNLFIDYDPDTKIYSEYNRNFDSLLRQISQVYDWDNQITRSYTFISEKIRENIEDVILQLNKSRELTCGGILLTGRGVYFDPLKSAIRNSLKQIKGLNDHHFIDTLDLDLKQVCMTGIFNKQMIAHSDVIATPVEIDPETNRQLKKRNFKKGIFRQWSGKVFSKIPSERIWEIFFSGNDGESYSEKNNSIQVQNLNTVNCRFRAGGNNYKIPIPVAGAISSAYVTLSRNGIYIIIKMASGSRRCIKLEPDSDFTIRNSKEIYQSLFPGYFKKQYL